MSKICKFLNGINFNLSHMDCLKKTPFYMLLDPFINKKINSQYLKGVQHGLVEILMSYNRDHKAFDVGGICWQSRRGSSSWFSELHQGITRSTWSNIPFMKHHLVKGGLHIEGIKKLQQQRRFEEHTILNLYHATDT